MNLKRLTLQLKKGYLSIVTDAVDKRKLRLVPTGKFEELHIALKTIRQMADNIKE